MNKTYMTPFWMKVLVALVWVSALQHLTVMAGQWGRFNFLMHPHVQIAGRLLREGMWLVSVAVIVVAWNRTGRFRHIPGWCQTLAMLLLLSCGLSAALSLSRDIPGNVILYGFRFIQYAILAYLLSALTLGEWRRLMQILVVSLVMLVFINLILGVLQLRTAPAIRGSTIFGSRAFGVFASPNDLGVFVATASFVVAIFGGKLRWLVLTTCLLLSAMTGSRSCVLIAFYSFMIYVTSFVSLRWLRAVTVVLAPAILYFALGVVSQQEISGRDIEEGVVDGRVHKLTEAWSVVSSNAQTLLLGKGFGLASNVAATMHGYNAYAGQVSAADSIYIFLLYNNGALGVLVYLLFFIVLTLSSKVSHTLPIVGFIALIGVANVYVEMFPANFLVCCLSAYVLSLRGAGRVSPVGIRRSAKRGAAVSRRQGSAMPQLSTG